MMINQNIARNLEIGATFNRDEMHFLRSLRDFPCRYE